jgi:hypothetical protein
MNKFLPLSFKGSRDYLHGSDFFNMLMSFAEKNTENPDSYVERITFRKYASKLCELTDTKPTSQEKVVGQVRYKIDSGNNDMNFWIVETDDPIFGRYPFDENVILNKTHFRQENRSVLLRERSKYTPIEDVIVLTKYLNNAISPIANGSWLFGQMDLTEPLIDNYNLLEIKMKNLIDGKFSVNDILIDERVIGSIRFIAGLKK